MSESRPDKKVRLAEMPTDSKPMQLGYWSIRGWGAPSRMLLHFVDAKFDNLAYDAPPELVWSDKKFNLGLDFPNLPYLIDGDFKLTQSLAILRYLGNKFGLGGSTPQMAATLDMFADVLNDWRCPMYGVPYKENHAEIIATEKEKWFYHAKRIEEYLDDIAFTSGSKLTWPEFLLYETADFQRTLVPGSLDTCPNILAFLKHFAALPQLESYFASDASKYKFLMGAQYEI